MGRLPHSLARASRTSVFALLVAGIAIIILMPVFFLFSLSLMSDAEAYNEWPLPLLPSLRARFKIEPAAAGVPGSVRVSLYSRTRGRYVPFVESGSATEIASFIRRKANCRVAADRIEAEIRRLDAGRQIDPETSVQRRPVEHRFILHKSLLANYLTFFRVTADAFPALLRSLWTALATIAISLAVGGTAGYAFARYRFKGRECLRLSVLFVRIFPGVAVAIPMVVILARMGMIDRPLGLALVYSVGQIALAVWITASVFMGIPVELEEAARIFGTTRTGAFFHVTLPLALPGLAACAMYAFIGSWNETIQAIVLTQANPTFPVVVYQSLVGSKGMVHLATAGGVAMALPAILFTLIIRKYILRMWGTVRL